MLKTIMHHELQQQLFSLRFLITLSIVLLVFSVSTISYIIENNENHKNYENLIAKQKQVLTEETSNATNVAKNRRWHYMQPRNNAFISSGNNIDQSFAFIYSAYNVFEYEQSQGKSNPFVLSNKTVNWEFIIILLFSFLAIVFAYDAISGEKEARTLALGLSNPVSRSTLFLGKFFGICITLTFFALLGSLLSVVILLFSKQVLFTALLVGEIGLFMLFSVIVIACFVAVSMMASVLSQSSNVSLLIGLSVWIFFMFIVPQTAMLLSDSLYKTDKAEMVKERMSKSRADIEKSFPNGKWQSASNNPFLPNHQIRAKMQMAFMENEKKYVDNIYGQYFTQFEKARKLTVLSPVSMFEYGNEYILNSGYTRFKQNWNALHNYQSQFLQWFRTVDSKDPQSPHWFNPYENLSTTRQSVKLEEIPVYSEQNMPFDKRIANVSAYVIILLFYTSLVLFFSLFKFVKYDVR